MDLGLEIRLLREKRRMTSKELAEKVGISQSQMSRLEKGQRRIDANMLEKIAQALGVPVGYFFERDRKTAEAVEEVEADVRYVMREVGRIVRQARHRVHLTPEELADRIGKPRSYVKAIEDGEMDYIPADVMQRLCKVLRIAPFDLMSVQQRIISDLKKQIVRLRQAHTESTLGAIEAGGRKLRAVPVFGSVATGYPSQFTMDGVPLGDVEDFVFVPRLDDEKAFGVFCIGDEMESPVAPSFREGDVLVFTVRMEVRNRDFAFVRVRGQKPLFRQVHFDPNARVRLQPLNHNYPPLVVLAHDILGMARLVAHIARL